jgi:hypothetical protein
VHVGSRPEFHVNSNGALGFAGSLIFCAGKWRKLFTELSLAYSLHFIHIRLNLQDNTNAPFERAYNSGLETTLGFYIYFVFAHDSCL